MSPPGDPARWPEIDEIFAAALEREGTERAAYLDAACPGELRGEVEALLAADAESGSFLDAPVADLLAGARSDEALPGERRLGSYRLLRQVGMGGMGTVYLAVRDDAQYERQVAIKVLRAGLTETEAYHRFLTERQILARLEHPGIARLYDGGTTADGRPYLVMEWIDGLPLAEYCDRHRLSVEDRLALFTRICAAVQYAHQNLLVHRDLKPGNILVTAAGEPRLIDFGIAKQLAPEGAPGAELTRTGLRMMTPSYASPEQVQGQTITTASDVYALGVLLYELLAGRSPYRVEGAFVYEMERAICEQEPERPSQAVARAPAAHEPTEPTPETIAAARSTHPKALGRRLAGDLDNVVLMALRKDPGRRYGSAAQLAEELASHLGDLPVRARPDTLAYRGRKFVRRHRPAVVAGVVALLVAAGFLVSLVEQGRRLARERDKARYALAFLVDVFQAADPHMTAGETLTAREILARGAARVSGEAAGEPEVQAAVLDAIGQVGLGLGQPAAAQPLLERALALRRRASGADSPEYAESLEHLASLRYERSDLAGALALLRQALAIERRRLPAGDVAVAKTLNLMGQMLTDTGTPAEIEPLHREALAIARRAEGPAGPTVAESLLGLSHVATARGAYARAEELYRQGLAIERRRLGPRHPVVAYRTAGLAEILTHEGKSGEAEAVLAASTAALGQALGPDHPDLATAVGNQAILAMQRGRHAEAEALYRRVLSIWEPRLGADDARLATTLANLAAAIQAQGRAREAIPLHQRALAMRRKIFGERHPQVGNSLLLLAQAHRELGEYDAALDLAQQALALLRQGLGPEHPIVASPLREVGRILLAQGRPAEAEGYLRQAVALRAKSLPPNHPELARATVTLGTCLVAEHRYQEAEPLLRQAYATLAAQLPGDDERVREARQALATLPQELAKEKTRHACGWPGCRCSVAAPSVRSAITLVQNGRAPRFPSETRTTQLPGRRFHSRMAARRPTPERR
ncbi:MAG TPA: serine/threonine-protein kinase [Thermoanaerobaculia bacterium]|nr:serine/threonine-protein kinase [Thermoanaerobaculia bacterium]